jgi:hypothetical protein
VLAAPTQAIATPEAPAATTEMPVPTAALRIRRRPTNTSPPAATDATEHIPAPPQPDEPKPSEPKPDADESPG